MSMTVMKRVRRANLLVTDRGPMEYLLSGLLHYGPRALLKPLRKKRRTQEEVLEEYNVFGREHADWLGTGDGVLRLENLEALDDLIYDDPVTPRLMMVDGQVRRGTRALARRVLLDTVEARLRSLLTDVPQSERKVVEFGSGTGRNVLELKRRMPDVEFVGLDLSPKKVEFATALAKRFDIDATFSQADVTGPLPDTVQNAALSYSIHALEQMPRIFKGAVDNMLKISSRGVVFYEPVAELYPSNLRGLVSRLRIRNADYLDGLYDYLLEVGAGVEHVELLGTCGNPFNQTVEIAVRT